MIDDKQGFIFARENRESLRFLCDRCGRIHSHGLKNGHRSSHCNSSDFSKFGNPYEGYELFKAFQQPGFLHSMEAKTIVDLCVIAERIVSNIATFLDIAEIDPTSRAAARIATAQKALMELASIDPVRQNPFELITDDGKQVDEP